MTRRLLAPAALLSVLLAACSTPDPVRRTVRGELTDDDERVPDDSSPYDRYTVEAARGWRIHVVMESDDFDPYLWLIFPSQAAARQVDDAEEGSTTAVIDLTAPASGTYTIRANSLRPEGRGRYRLTIEAGPAEPGDH